MTIRVVAFWFDHFAFGRVLESLRGLEKIAMENPFIRLRSLALNLLMPTGTIPKRNLLRQSDA